MRLSEWLLLRLSRPPDTPDYPSVGTADSLDHALRQVLEPFPDFTDRIAGRDVLDFGCGLGYQATAMALHGARRVVGVDIDAAGLEYGRRLAAEAGVADRVAFRDRLGGAHRDRFDVVLSLNSMEHFADPGGTLELMAEAVRPGGSLFITFSPPWFAPYGSHMYHFTRVPWVHLIFPERTVMAVRARYRRDGAKRYEEVEGGLNRMSLRKFHGLVRGSGLELRTARYDPVRGIPVLTRLPLFRELFTNRVSCVLEKA